MRSKTKTLHFMHSIGYFLLASRPTCIALISIHALSYDNCQSSFSNVYFYTKSLSDFVDGSLNDCCVSPLLSASRELQSASDATLLAMTESKRIIGRAVLRWQAQLCGIRPVSNGKVPRRR